jgi:flagellar basal body rod protein FlgC
MLGAIGNSFGSGYSISASGLMDAALRLNGASQNIANANTKGFAPVQVSSLAEPAGGVKSSVASDSLALAFLHTDYAMEGINLLMAKHAFQANANALKAQMQSERSLLDVFG